MIIIKPDAFERGLVGELLGSFEQQIEQMYSGRFSVENCRHHYVAHLGKPYYHALEQHMISGISLFVKVNMRWEIARDLALRLRDHYGVEGPRNLIHASDSAEADLAETTYWFKT